MREGGEKENKDLPFSRGIETLVYGCSCSSWFVNVFEKNGKVTEKQPRVKKNLTAELHPCIRLSKQNLTVIVS